MKKLTTIFLFPIFLFCSCLSGQQETGQNYKELVDSIYELLDAKKIDEATVLANEIITTDPEDAYGHYLLGLCQKSLDNCKDAILSFSKAVILDSTFGGAYYYRADCYLQEGKKDRAYMDIDRALKVDTNYSFQLAASDFVRANFDEEYIEQMSFKQGNVKVEYSRNEQGIKHGKWTAFYPDGSIFREGNYNEGIRDGYDRRYFKNGQLHYEKHYKNDVVHGPYKSYHENGQLSTEGTFVNGEWDGVMKGWYETGEPEYEHNLRFGQNHGLQTTWFKNGTIKLQLNYLNGKLNGEAIVWDEESKTHLIEVYKNGHMIEKRK